MSIFFHEQQYRTAVVMAKLKQFPIAICGAGALGANITETLARSGCGQLTLIDRDRVEERNLSTQPYSRTDVGTFKAKILANSIYRAVGTQVIPKTKELTTENVASLIKNSALIIDTFDNSISRKIVKDYCLEKGLSCLHAGLAAGYGEIIWNADYHVPSPANDDICDYPLARNLVLLTVAVTCEAIVRFISTQEMKSFTVTLQDLSLQLIPGFVSQ